MGKKVRECPETMVIRLGQKNVETVCKAAHDMGIKYLTMYAFRQKLEQTGGRGGSTHEAAGKLSEELY